MGRLRNIARRIKRKITKQPEHFLTHAKGVIHVGANLGQEKNIYQHYNLNVAWIEPIPEIFSQLKKNIADIDKQRAYQYLVTDIDHKEYQFNIANNFGASSSIFKFKQHKDIWPSVEFEKKINLTSVTLKTVIEKENIELSTFDTLIMDTQGSELLVLKGAGDLLNNFQYIKTEAADFEAYENCCQLKDLDDYLATFQFEQIRKDKFAEHKDGGKYYDIVYRNSNFLKK